MTSTSVDRRGIGAMMACMHAVVLQPPEASTRRLLGDDRPRDLVRVVALVLGFAVLDRLLAASSRLGGDDGERPVLAVAAVARNWAPTAVVLVAVGAAAMLGRSRTRLGWKAMDHGDVWRWLIVPWVVTATWYWTTYDFNFMLGRWHAIDRALIVALAIAAIVHPLFIVAFAWQANVVASQMALTSGGTPTLGVDHLLMTAILVIAATFLLVLVTDDDDTSPGLLLLATAVAAHFFVPGRAKIALDWLSTTDLHHFAYSSYTAGWRADGDGSWAESMASLTRTFRWPALIGTVVLEVGAVVAVTRRALLRWWLPGWILLHVSILLVSGFWLFPWLIVEIGLLNALWRRGLTTWMSRNDTIARGALAAAIVMLGSAVFSPPRLAWLDSPLSYGYEVDAVGVSGTVYHVPSDRFGLAQQDLAFLFARFTDRPPAVAGYGATAGADFYARLGKITDFRGLRELERTFQPVTEAERAASERLITSWLDRVNDAGGDPWFLIEPPSRYWVDRPTPTFDGEEPLSSVEVILVRSLHDDEGQRFDRETVLRVEVGDDGRAFVIERTGIDADA